MTTTADASINLAIEGTFKTFQTPTRALEFTDESFDLNKMTKQGAGLRVGSRVPRSARRVVPSADVGGDVTVEAISRGMGLLWQLCMGTGVSTLVAGATYQHLFTLGDVLPSATIQKGTVQAGGTVDAISFLGCTVSQFEFSFGNQDIATLKTSFDGADLTTAQAYAAPSYPANGNLFHFANATIASGALTAPTATTLASAATTLANVRGGSVQVSNNVRNDRFNLGGGGRKAKQLTGLRAITGKLDVEYDSTTFRDALIADTPLSLVLTYTAGALSTGLETLQVVLPELKFDGELPKTNGADLVVPGMGFTVLDNLTAAQPMWVVMRTADTAL